MTLGTRKGIFVVTRFHEFMAVNFDDARNKSKPAPLGMKQTLERMR